MQSFTKNLRRAVAYFTALVLVAGYPLSVMAETQEPTTPPVQTVETVEQAPVVTTEEQQPAYTYNPETNTWDSDRWVFNPETNAYERPPAPAPVIEPTVIEPVQDANTSEVEKNVETNVTIDNNLKSDAVSGDSTVNYNTLAGNAATGDAAAMATLVNVVNSSVTTGDNQKVAQFTQDIMGDVKGDIILYPMLLKAMLEAEAGQAGSTINVENNLQLNNNIDLNATSGDAAVTNNTTAGDATTGNAAAVANVVNILNSMIATQQSFIGTINIYGSLEGDILIAPDFIPQMIASNGDGTSSTQVSNETTTDIVNNISAMAESGAAAVLNNTTGGNATTGSADTGIVIFNLTGHEIIAKNSLLVFVNVLGEWVGVIVDAPEGATAALIGNEVTKSEYAPDLTVNSESNHGITNTIAVNAQTGDAVVSGNTTAGNATTGSAKAMANIANVSGSQFGITDWFGVLFINVFQDWHGSFGINTFYGDPETTSVPKEQPTGPIQFVQNNETTTKQAKTNNTNTTSYVAMASSSQTATPNTPTATFVDVVEDEPEVAEVLGKTASAENLFDSGVDYRLFVIAGSLLAVGLSLLGLKRLFS